MSCCGKKRKAWMNQAPPTATQANITIPENSAERKSRIFEYTGKLSKKISGVSTGRVYFFRFPGHKIHVPYEDSFALMAESDLKIQN